MIFGEDVIVWAGFLALGAAIAGLIWLFILERRLKGFFRGKKAEDLGGVIAEIQSGLEYFIKKEKDIDDFLADIDKRVKRSAQHLGIVRFNPYSDVGGDQSFSIAILDERQNGFVVTGLYGREQSRFYAKPITAGRPQHQLSDEEKEAIGKALNII